MPTDLLKLQDFAARYAAAWCSHEAPSVAAFYSQDGSLSVNGSTPAVGRKAIADLAQGFMSTFPDLQVLLDELLIEGERAEFHWTLIGTNTGPGGTRHHVRISGFEAWNIGEDGLIAESQGHFDNADYQYQLEHGLDESR